MMHCQKNIKLRINKLCHNKHSVLRYKECRILQFLVKIMYIHKCNVIWYERNNVVCF